MPVTPRFYTPLLFCTVFTTGAAVLIFEITAVRALSPYFGTSMYVVSGVLTVILAALSVGYYIGGRLADRYPDPRLLYLLIGMSGLIMNACYLIAQYTFPIAGMLLPTTIGPLILALLFFFIPAFLLGIDSPFVIKLLTKVADDTHNGAMVGSTFFWSTIGSIVGSLLSGFFLIPFIGVRLSIVGTATLLSLGACFAYLYLHPYTRHRLPFVPLSWILLIAIVSTTLGCLTIRSSGVDTRAGELLWRGDGYYSQVEVRELALPTGAIMRSMFREVNNSSAVILGTTTYAFPYAAYARSHQYLELPAKNFLVLGGGAYTIPRTLLLEDPTIKVDVVEIEPILLPLAYQYFDLPKDPRLRNFTQDARVFLLHTPDVYDVIFSDAFNSGHYIPAHLTTQEFFLLVRSRLTPNGLFIANVIGQTTLDERSLTGSLLKTIQSVFPNMVVYTTDPTAHTRLQNLLVLARADDSTAHLPDETILPSYGARNYLSADVLTIPLQAFHFDRQTIFTDDKASVEYLVARQIVTSQQLR